MYIVGEEKGIESLTYNKLYEETRLYAAALKKLGLQIGDRVTCKHNNLLFISIVIF